MNNVFFTSDCHFDHKNIIKYCDRPFNDVDEMNETIIRNWNSVVGENDFVYHLGDFSFHNKDPYHWLDRLNGNIILIQGNHDRKFDKAMEYGAVIFKEKEVVVIECGVEITLSHYPPEEDVILDGLYLYGHTHRDVTPNCQLAHHVGCDSWNFTPVTLKQILEKE